MIPVEDDRASVIVPEKLLRLVSVTVDVPPALVSMVSEVGMADMENSETLTVVVVERERVPLVPLTETA